MYAIFQIDHEAHPQQCRNAMMFGLAPSLCNKENVERWMAEGVYRKVAEVQARGLEHVFALTNLWNDEAAVKRLYPMHSLSVGDVVQDEQGVNHVVAPFGFEALKATEET